jgi:hypothetical protein
MSSINIVISNNVTWNLWPLGTSCNDSVHICSSGLFFYCKVVKLLSDIVYYLMDNIQDSFKVSKHSVKIDNMQPRFGKVN